MAGFSGIEQREVVRVKVKKYEGFMQPECKRFSLDPQITSYEMLQHIIASAFNVKGDFTMSYLAKDDEGQEIYLSMLSDWDMDAAFQSASDPYLQLKVDTKPFEEGLEDWDIIAPLDVPQHKISSYLVERNTILSSLTGTISSGVGKTFTHMQRAMVCTKLVRLPDFVRSQANCLPGASNCIVESDNSYMYMLTSCLAGIKVEDESKYKASKGPMSDMEFRNYLDSSGHMIKPEEFRLSIYQGGAEQSLRRVSWRHLLNIFPNGMSGRERFDFMKKKETEYYQLREQWKQQIQSGNGTEEIKYVTSMVKKDVLRTDRTHKFYSGSDDNKNLLALFHMLVTYALTHPKTSYCQGMSDIASPLLVIQKDEAQAYLCFCGLMKRMKDNFNISGATITTKFKHLSDLLMLHDPVLFSYLKEINAHDLFFSYRWLLLELKREFPFDESLYMLEVMWSTLPPDPPELDLPLADPDYSPILLSSSPCSPSFTMKQTVYAKLISLRKNRSSSRPVPKNTDTLKEKEIACGSANNNSRVLVTEEVPQVDLQEYPCMEDAETKAVIKQSSLIDKTLEVKHSSLSDSHSCLTMPDTSHMKMKNKGLGKLVCQDASPEPDQEKSCQIVEEKSYMSSVSKAHMNEANNEHSTEMKSDWPKEHENIDLDSEMTENNQTASHLVSERSDVIDTDAYERDEPESEIEDDSIDSQFHISIDASDGKREEQVSSDIVQQQFTGFFQNVKRLLSSPKKHPKDMGITKPEIQQRNNEKLPDREVCKPMLLSDIREQKVGSTDDPNLMTGKRDMKTASVVSNQQDIHVRGHSSYQVDRKTASHKSYKQKPNTEMHCRYQQDVEAVKCLSNKQDVNMSSHQRYKHNAKTENNWSDKHDYKIANSPSNIQNAKTENCLSDLEDLKTVSDQQDVERVTHQHVTDFETHGNTSIDVANVKSQLDQYASESSLEMVKCDVTIKLPPPEEFGCGNPFLMFLCLTLLLQHRDLILQNKLEYDEIAIMFDKLVRKHNVHKVLHQARNLYSEYLRSQQKILDDVDLSV